VEGFSDTLCSMERLFSVVLFSGGLIHVIQFLPWVPLSLYDICLLPPKDIMSALHRNWKTWLLFLPRLWICSDFGADGTLGFCYLKTQMMYLHIVVNTQKDCYCWLKIWKQNYIYIYKFFWVKFTLKRKIRPKL